MACLTVCAVAVVVVVVSTAMTGRTAVVGNACLFLPLTFWRRTFFQILAHPVFKM